MITKTNMEAVNSAMFESPATLIDRIESVIGSLQACGCDLHANSAEELFENVSDPEQAVAELNELANLMQEFARLQQEAA